MASEPETGAKRSTARTSPTFLQRVVRHVAEVQVVKWLDVHEAVRCAQELPEFRKPGVRHR